MGKIRGNDDRNEKFIQNFGRETSREDSSLKT